MNNVNILGGGVYGCLLATALARKLSEKVLNQTQIQILERGNQILPSWTSVKLEHIKFNGGFYGIEVPRAKAALSLMSPEISEEVLEPMANLKLIYIDKELIPFRHPRKYWPNHLLEGIPNKNHNKEFDIINDQSFRNSRIGKILETISKRYSDQLVDSWHLLYPWFFPYEYSFPNNDEGLIVQQSALSGESDSYYLVPKCGLFEELKKPFEMNLTAERINIRKNWEPSSMKKFLENDSKTTLNIWTASAPALAKTLNIKLDSQWTGGERYFFLMALSTDKSKLKFLEEKYEKLPSEIIYASQHAPELARVSFTKTANDISYTAQDVLIVAEIFSQQNELTGESIKSIQATINHSLYLEQTTYIGITKTRRFDITSPNKVKAAEQELLSKITEFNILTPYLYWWPINMAKCGIKAMEDSKTLADLISRGK